MNTIRLSIIICALSVQVAYTQSSDHIDGGHFAKIIEYNNYGSNAQYNLQSKSTLDKVLFGMSNSFVEYVFQPPFSDVTAFRIVQGKHNRYTLELFRLSDSQKILSLLHRNATMTVLPDTMRAAGVFGLHVSQMVDERNQRIAIANQQGRTYQQFSVKPQSFRISEEFAWELHDKISVLIRDFRAERTRLADNRIVAGIMDGEHVTFRCIVEDELWTLNIHVPQHKAHQLAAICNQIITDMENSKNKTLNEAQYLALLNNIDL